MRIKGKYKNPDPGLWGLTVSGKGELTIGGVSAVDLAAEYGTPLHVVNQDRLFDTALNFHQSVTNNYPGNSSVHYAFKCNPVPGIIKVIRKAGLKAEVMSEFELKLAFRSGFREEEIIVNGPFKPGKFLFECLSKKVRLIVVDSLYELDLLNRICREQKTESDILIRINPDFTPKGMNQGSATASRKGSPFGFDLAGGEAEIAFQKLEKFPGIRFQGIHFHIGTGIHDPNEYKVALMKLNGLVKSMKRLGYKINILDAGGGFGVATSREMTSFEMLKYQTFGFLPQWYPNKKNPAPDQFVKKIYEGLEFLFDNDELPELILEPGRSITSSNQILLLSVHQVKERKGVHKWLITDGGIGTVTMPTFYEFHQIYLCNEVHRMNSDRITISGPGCFAADMVYRNIRMPEIKSGEVLAIMDSGAYFTSWESSFSHPLPAIITVSGGKHQLIRKRETFEEMIQRDSFFLHPGLDSISF